MSGERECAGNCPRCGWESADGAFFCARCGESLAGTPREAWYLRTSVLVIAFLAVGPFAIPLVWANPRFTAAKKAVVTAAMAVVTALLVWLFVHSLKQIHTCYNLITEPWPGAVSHPRGEVESP